MSDLASVMLRQSRPRAWRDSKNQQATAHHDKIGARGVASFTLAEGIELHRVRVNGCHKGELP
ncbi:MAG TPA: hypothetical protein VLC06_02155 [Polyangia bacterium]|jgi:hypothetical protein|nr:hypothetical protein [Polyangia bacterium]